MTSVPSSSAKMKGGALSLLANASANGTSIHRAEVIEPSRASGSASRHASNSTQAMNTSGFGESAEFAIAGTRVRKPRPNSFRSSMQVAANRTSIRIEMPSITLVSCIALTGISISSYSFG